MLMTHEIKQIVDVIASKRLDTVLKNVFHDFSRERLKKIIKEGGLIINGATVYDPSKRVIGELNLTLKLPEPVECKPKAEPIGLEIVYEDEHLLVINKAAGLVVHPGAGNPNGTLVNALLNHCQGTLSGIGGILRPGIVHRLDKETSGLMVVAKADQAHVNLTEQFQNKSIYRVYHALVWGVPKPSSGTINLPLARDTHNRTKMSIKHRTGKASITHYTVLQTYKNNASLVECKLETGRTHQIRVHMCTIGHGLIGDPVYKSPGHLYPKDLAGQFTKIVPFPHRQALHAIKLCFIHPIHKQEMIFETQYPDDFKEYLTILERYSQMS